MNTGTFLGGCNTGGGGSGGGGTVTSITEDVNLFPEVLVNGVASYTITGSGTFAWSKHVQNANKVWAGPIGGGDAVPVFRLLVPQDGEGAFWTITGNSNTVAGTNFIGTNDNVSWVIKTNGAERARVLNTGFFGIGTATPERLLDVGPDTGHLGGGGSGIGRMGVQDSGTYGAVYNVKAYGAVMDGVTDDGSAVNGAVLQIEDDFSKGTIPSEGASLFFPPGTCYMEAGSSGQNIIQTGIGINLIGCGIGVTFIKAKMFEDMSSGNVAFWSIRSPALHETNPDGLFHGPEVRGISFDCNHSFRPQYYVCVTVDGSSTKPVEGTRIIDCEMNYGMHGVGLYECAAVKIDGLKTRPGNYLSEVDIFNTTYPDAGDSTLINCDFQSRLMPTGIQVDVNGSNGLRIVNNKFNGSGAFGDGPHSHLRFQGTGAPPQIALIQANSFEGSDRYTAKFEGTWPGPANRIVIVGNQMDDLKGTGGNRILFAPAGTYGCDGVIIANNDFARSANDGNDYKFIELASTAAGACSHFTFTGNSFTTVRATDTAISTTANATANHIGDNRYNGFTSPVVTAAGSTAEGITLYGSNTFGNFIACYKDGSAGANLKFWVEAQGNARARFLDIGPRVDGTVASPANIVNISDANYGAGTGSMLTQEINRTGAFAGFYARQDVGTFTGAFYGVQANTTAGGAAGSGTFTGNYWLFQKNGATVVSYLNYLGQMFLINSADPATPTGGAIIYAKTGGLYAIGTAGTITKLADP